MIPALVGRLLALGYEVVVHDTMAQLSASSVIPGLRLLTEFVDDLGAAMAHCDLVICPMQFENYVHRMSGVVCCAVASGVPLVFPAGTLSSMRFHPLGSSACYIEHSVEGILQAVATVAADYPFYAKGAKRGAQYWRDNHGVDRFVDRALREILP